MTMKTVGLNIKCVAPFAGAWIEIHARALDEVMQVESLPSRERGLKFV